MDSKNFFLIQLATCIASSPIVYIPHPHYNFVDAALRDLLANPSGDTKRCSSFFPQLTYDSIYEFDYSRGFHIDFLTKNKCGDETDYQTRICNIISSVDEPQRYKERILIYKNLAEALQEPSFQLALQTFAELYENGRLDSLFTIVIVDARPVSSLPLCLSPFVTVIDVPLPSMGEIKNKVSEIPVSKQFEINKSELQDDLCRTLQGLHYFEINQILRSALIKSNGFLTKKMIGYALDEKKQIVKKSGILDVVDTDVSFNQIGGLDILKDDLRKVSTLFHNLREVSSLHLPIPKGILIMGMPGCGKSMIAKSIAKEFNVSLLRLDISRLMGQYVGQSEENLRRALAIAEAVHPCVLWIDEIEKAFVGANSGSGNNEDLLVTRMMGYFLTWMQERKTSVFIVATANDVMRPEFMRKGRFDEVYFVDFPSKQERREIFTKTLLPYLHYTSDIFDFSGITEKNAKDLAPIIISEITEKMDGFSGSEIASVVHETIKAAYVDYVHKREKCLTENIAMSKLEIGASRFSEIASDFSKSVMSKQTGKGKELTPIDRIRAIQEIYKFRAASR